MPEFAVPSRWLFRSSVLALSAVLLPGFLISFRIPHPINGTALPLQLGLSVLIVTVIYVGFLLTQVDARIMLFRIGQEVKNQIDLPRFRMGDSPPHA